MHELSYGGRVVSGFGLRGFGLGDAEADQEKVNWQTALSLIKVFKGEELTRSDTLAIASTAITIIAIAAGMAAPVTLALGAAVLISEGVTQGYLAAYNELFPDKPKIIDTSCYPENAPRDENDPRWHFFGRNYGINKGTRYLPGTFDAFAGPLLKQAWEGNWNCKAAVPIVPFLLTLVSMWNKAHGGAIVPGGSNAIPIYIRTPYQGSGNPDFDGNYDNPVTASISALSSYGMPAQIVLREGPYVEDSHPLPPTIKFPSETWVPIVQTPNIDLPINQTVNAPGTNGMSAGKKVAIGIGVVGASAAAYSYFTHGIVRRLIQGRR